MSEVQLNLRGDAAPGSHPTPPDDDTTTHGPSGESSPRGAFLIGAITTLVVIVYLQASGTMDVVLDAVGLSSGRPVDGGQGLHRHFLGVTGEAEASGPDVEELSEENRLLRESEAQLRALIDQLEERLESRAEELERLSSERTTLLAERVEMEAELEALREVEHDLLRWSGSGLSRDAESGLLERHARVVELDRDLGLAVIDRGGSHGMHEGTRLATRPDASGRKLELLVDEVRPRLSIARVLTPGGAEALETDAIVVVED